MTIAWVIQLAVLIAFADTTFGASRAVFPTISPGGGGTIAYNGIINIESSQARHMCWAADSTPVCTKLLCSAGHGIIGDYGTIQLRDAIPATRTTGGALTLTVLGCDSDGQPTEPKIVTYQVVPTPTFEPAGPHVTTSSIKITAPLASRICWTTTLGFIPACTGDGGCGPSQTITGASGMATIGEPFTTLKAVACAEENVGSGIASQTFILPPTFTPASGSIAYHSAVVMVSAGANYICWSKDGTEPKCMPKPGSLCAAGTTAFGDSATLQRLVLEGRTMGGSLTIKAVGCDAQNTATELRSVTYRIVPKPTFEPSGPGIPLGTPIKISAEGASRICWTVSKYAVPMCAAGGQCGMSTGVIEGSVGTPFQMGADLTPLQAVACADGDASSGTSQQSFILQPPVDIPPPHCTECAPPPPEALVTHPEPGRVEPGVDLSARPPINTAYIVWTITKGYAPTCVVPVGDEAKVQKAPVMGAEWTYYQMPSHGIEVGIVACDAQDKPITATVRSYSSRFGSGGEDDAASASIGLPVIIGASAGGVFALGLAAYFVWRCRRAQPAPNKDSTDVHPTRAPHSSTEPHATERDARRRSSAATRV